MWSQSLLTAVGGTAGLLYVIYWILSNRKRTNLKGKVVLITGANSGLGKACAKAFFMRGCKVILAGRNMTELQTAQDELRALQLQSSDNLAILKVDLSDLDSLEKKGSEAKALFGAVDILINNAGISYRGSIMETDLIVHQRVMNVNYFGQIALTKALLPVIKESDSGHIVAVSSIQGRISQAYRSAYAASKHSLQAYFDCLRAELWDTSVHVCVVNPGYIQTNLSRNAVCADGTAYGVTDNTQASGLKPDKVANTIVHAVETNTPEVFPAALTYRLAVMIRPLLPRLMFSILAKRAKKQSQLLPHLKTS